MHIYERYERVLWQRPKRKRGGVKGACKKSNFVRQMEMSLQMAKSVLNYLMDWSWALVVTGSDLKANSWQMCCSDLGDMQVPIFGV